MKKKTERESFTELITVQASECEEFTLISVRFVKSLCAEIDRLRAELGLPVHQWESAAKSESSHGRAVLTASTEE